MQPMPNPHRSQMSSSNKSDETSKPNLTESRRALLKRLTVNAALDAIRPGTGRTDWQSLARPDQRAPAHDAWTTWLLLGGRGAGKTRAGAEWIRAVVAKFIRRSESDTPPRIALVAETYADAREVMIEGQSGLRAIEPAQTRPEYQASRRRLEWPNGAVAHCFSAEDPDGIRGYQFDAAWSDELCKWRYPEETWSNLQLALRLGERPRQVATTTPRPMALLKRLMASPTTVVTRASTYANRQNLAEAFLTEIASAYEGTALGRQELLGEIIEDVEGALWSWAMIEAARISLVPDLDRIVVAVDPPATSGPNADECGIIVAGKTDIQGAPTGFVLADRSGAGMTPVQWAERAVAAYRAFEADRIVVEVNQGGEMVRAVIAQVDPGAPVRSVRAHRGKHLRAEPIAALYEQGRVRHAGVFEKLESQMTTFTGQRASGSAKNTGASPDRLDALVWALSDLLLTPSQPRPGVRNIV